MQRATTSRSDSSHELLHGERLLGKMGQVLALRLQSCAPRTPVLVISECPAAHTMPSVPLHASAAPHITGALSDSEQLTQTHSG